MLFFGQIKMIDFLSFNIWVPQKVLIKKTNFELKNCFAFLQELLQILEIAAFGLWLDVSFTTDVMFIRLSRMA